jgi:hypothetical protein
MIASERKPVVRIAWLQQAGSERSRSRLMARRTERREIPRLRRLRPE